MAKIPQELRLILSCGMSDEWVLDTLMKSFAGEIQIRERYALGPVAHQWKMREKRGFGYGLRFGQNKKKPTSSKLVSNSDRPQQHKEMWCTFSTGPYPLTKCAVTEPEGKKRIPCQKGRCFGWLFEEWSCEPRLPSEMLSLWWETSCIIMRRTKLFTTVDTSKKNHSGTNCEYKFGEMEKILTI